MRESIAPAIAAEREEDQGLAVGGRAVILRLAGDNIFTNQMLDTVVALSINNSDDKRDVHALERRLREVAKLQNDALNQISGTADTQDLVALYASGNPMAGQGGYRDRAPGSAQLLSVSSTPSMRVAQHNVDIIRGQIAEKEATVLPMLQPLIARCR